MSSEQFGFVKSARSAVISSAVDSKDQTEDACKNDDPTAPPSKRRHFNSNWTEGHTWLKHDQDNSVMFCEWCRRFDRNEHRNQFVKGCSSMKLESVKKHEESSQHRQHNVPVLGHTALWWNSPYRPWNETRLSRWNAFSTLGFTLLKLTAHFVISLLCCNSKGWMVCKQTVLILKVT